LRQKAYDIPKVYPQIEIVIYLYVILNESVVQYNDQMYGREEG